MDVLVQDMDVSFLMPWWTSRRKHSHHVQPSIGIWHVHGHKTECFSWCGLGGEIMETLWSSLNIISPSARGMATPHQQELLDFQMNDSNFLKMVWMSLVLKKKIKSTQKSLATVTEAFDNLNTQAPEHLWQLWSEQESKALTDWLVDSWAMDIFDVQLERAPTVNPIEMDLISQQDEEPQGSATWIAKALKVEELQIALEIDSQQMNAMTTKVQQLSIAWHQDQLHSQLEGLVALMGWFLENDWEDELLPDYPGTTPGEGDGVDEIENLFGQANDCLHEAVIFWRDVRHAWGWIASTDATLQHYARIYCQCCRQMVALDASMDILDQYSIAEPNARGHQDDTLAWFWTMDLPCDTDKNDWMSECKLSLPCWAVSRTKGQSP
ncbi:hypothetical protein V8B97DRAFT_2022219 [Scleroderma yunnanense]